MLNSPPLPEAHPADRFPGGKAALHHYLSRNLQYPDLALKEKRSGQVLIQVSVDAKGRLKDFKSLQADHDLFAGEALRVLKAMPEWLPGEPKQPALTLAFPIVFYLQDQGATPPALAKPVPGNYQLLEPFFLGALADPMAVRPATRPAGPANASGDKIFTMVEKKPEFPGGDNEMNIFIKKNLRYPAEALRNGKQGLVVLQFVVDTEGKIRDIQVVKAMGYGMDEEAMRVVALMPDFTPAIQRGKPVSFRYTLPIRYGLQKSTTTTRSRMLDPRDIGRKRAFE
ncbi:MAG: energy transducer TonB [Adhaeribacter sp.]